MNTAEPWEQCSGTGRERYSTSTRACSYCDGKGFVAPASAESDWPQAPPQVTAATRYVALYHAHGTGVWRCSRAYRAKRDALARVGELYIEQQCDAAVVAQIDVED